MRPRAPLFFFLILFSISPLIYNGCARQTIADAPEVYEPPPALEEERAEEPPAKESSVYDLETEMPEQDDVEPGDYEESIEPVPADTVQIEEIAVPSKPEEMFGIGYRIQIFASSELESAESTKRKAAGEVALPIYIEYEGGYYKVRIGDFASREEAAAVRAKIAEIYPDCWIVSTTIRK